MQFRVNISPYFFYICSNSITLFVFRFFFLTIININFFPFVAEMSGIISTFALPILKCK